MPTLTTFGGPLTEIYNTASFGVTSDFNQVQGTFNWTPNMSDVRDLPYLMVFNSKAAINAEGLGGVKTEVLLITVLDPGENSIQNIEASKINIFPNPVSKSCALEIDSPSDQMYTIYSSLGAPLISERISQNNQTIDVFGLSANVYFLRVENNMIRLEKTD